MYFDVQKFLILKKSHLSSFYFVAHVFGVRSKSLELKFQTLDSKESKTKVPEYLLIH